MKIISKYLIKEIIKYAIICESIFYVIYLSFDFLGKIDNFIEAGVSWDKIFYYFLFKSPLIIAQMMPPSMLISVIIVFSLLRRRNELTALKSHGIDLIETFFPVLVFSFFLSISLFLFTELVVPYCSSSYNKIWLLDVEKRDPSYIFGLENVWYKGDDIIYQMERFDPETKTMKRPTLYFLNNKFGLKGRVDALSASWDGDGWVFHNGVRQDKDESGMFVPVRFEKLKLKLKETPDCFLRKEKDPEEMSYWELKRFSKRLGQEGYDNTRYMVDLNFRLSFPFIIFIMTLIGIPVALRIQKGGIAFSVAVGVLITFLYTMAIVYSRNLGLSGKLSPFFCAWIPNIIFLTSGFLVFKGIDR